MMIVLSVLVKRLTLSLNHATIFACVMSAVDKLKEVQMRVQSVELILQVLKE